MNLWISILLIAFNIFIGLYAHISSYWKIIFWFFILIIWVNNILVLFYILIWCMSLKLIFFNSFELFIWMLDITSMLDLRHKSLGFKFWNTVLSICQAIAPVIACPIVYYLGIHFWTYTTASSTTILISHLCTITVSHLLIIILSFIILYF